MYRCQRVEKHFKETAGLIYNVDISLNMVCCCLDVCSELDYECVCPEVIAAKMSAAPATWLSVVTFELPHSLPVRCQVT